jgi:prepilin-type N-terminal cleavage/methylation domain-containing protein/prepilin-type processing-associated H-X9-DG protein
VTCRGPRRGFSIIELLVVIGIVAIILSLFFPSFARSRELSRSLACRNNLRQIGVAFHVYQCLNERFPIGYTANRDANPLKSNPGWGWTYRILPHMEQSILSASIDVSQPTGSPGCVSARSYASGAYICPSDRETGIFRIAGENGKPLALVVAASYAGSFGAGGDIANDPASGNGFFARNRAFTLDDFQDGLSNTFAVGERGSLHTKAPWIGVIEGGVCTITPGAPSRSQKTGRGAVQVFAHVGDKPMNSNLSDPDDFFSPHQDGGNFLMGDGAVRFMRQSIAQAAFRALATRDGTEVLPRGSP